MFSIDNVTNISSLHFVVLMLFTVRLVHLLVDDEIFAPIRQYLYSRSEFLGSLISCYWCVSMWIAPVIVFSYALFPSITFLIGCIFAISALVSLILTARYE